MLKKKGLSEISRRILDLLKAHPDGLLAGEIRHKLGLKPGEQAQLDRRKRDLYRYYQIDKVGKGQNVRYVYRGERSEPLTPSLNLKKRAEALHRAHGRCGMCGRSLEKHGINLVVDHKIPKNWGGTDESENLWALCEECNSGKKNYFESFDPTVMRAVMTHDSPHVRIGELLKLFFKKPVDSWLIEFVAKDQEDWPKRTRDLRYLGWEIDVGKKKNPTTGRITSFYVLQSFTEWPDDPTKSIRDYEAERARRNRRKK